MSPSGVLLRPDEDPRHELALQLASRFTALVRSARAYAVGHVTYTKQLENYLALLTPALEERGVVRFDAPEGELCLNGEPVPYRPNMQKAVEALAQEFAARSIEGIEFKKGLMLAELEAFMSYFLPGERWKGSELIAACDDAGLVHARALPVRRPTAPLAAEAEAGVPVEALGSARGAWTALLSAARALLEGDTLDQGIELRHVKRAIQPLVDAVLAGERVIAVLAQVAPGESAWSHAAHTVATALCVGARLGLSRHELSDLAVAALLHDAGHGWGEAGGPEMVEEHRQPAEHTFEGLRRLAWSTTLNPSSLGAMRAAIEHHEPRPGEPPATALLSQLVSIADAYVTLLSRGESSESRLSPHGALVRVVGPLRERWHPALPIALVRVLGVHPPGQVVELDDGTVARTLAPDREDPERPWVELIADARSGFVPASRRRSVPLPAGRFVARALPRDEWPRDPRERPAA